MDNLSQMQFEANEASEVCALHKAVKKFIRQCTNNLKYCPKLRKQHKFHHEKDSLFGRNGLNAFFVLHTFVFGWQWPSNRCANQTEKTSHTFIDGLINGLTFGIYCPTTTTVTK